MNQANHPSAFVNHFIGNSHFLPSSKSTEFKLYTFWITNVLHQNSQRKTSRTPQSGRKWNENWNELKRHPFIQSIASLREWKKTKLTTEYMKTWIQKQEKQHTHNIKEKKTNIDHLEMIGRSMKMVNFIQWNRSLHLHIAHRVSHYAEKQFSMPCKRFSLNLDKLRSNFKSEMKTQNCLSTCYRWNNGQKHASLTFFAASKCLSFDRNKTNAKKNHRHQKKKNERTSSIHALPRWLDANVKWKKEYKIACDYKQKSYKTSSHSKLMFRLSHIHLDRISPIQSI